MTSNLGSHFFREDEKPERIRQLVLESLREAFRPEFLNRIDEIVIFKALGREEIETIVKIQLRHLTKRLADKRITLELSPAAEALLAKEGYDPVYGARPLKRTIQRLIQDPLALQLLNGSFAEGDTIVVKPGESGKLAFEKGAVPAAARASAPTDPRPGPPTEPWTRTRSFSNS
jgi:ATP-dependent Clp protease ATP-binding subunit ClpB